MSDDEVNNQPVSKKQRVIQKYRDSYNKEWPCFIKSNKSENRVFCTDCGSDFSIASGGRDDCRRHYGAKKHKENAKHKALSTSVLDFNKKAPSENDVIRAEMLFSSFIIEHNIPISSSEHAGSLFRAMFPDSAIAKKYASKRTKTTAIIKSMALFTQNNIFDILKNNPFALASDGSNDVNDVKLYPLVVSYFNEAQGKIETTLLSIIECAENTGEAIFKNIDVEFAKKEIPWTNCVSFSCDNAYTMIGHIKGVSSFIQKVQPEIAIQGCSCHLIHLAAKKATAGLKQIDVKDFLVQLYYYLDKSSKRKHAFKLCQDVIGNEKPHKIVKYINTRWLSLLDAVNRLLEQWDPVVTFLTSENCESLKKYIENPLLKLYLLFLSNVLPLYVNTNVSLQQEAPAIHLLHRKMNNLLMELLSRFIKPSAVNENSKSILDVDFKKRKNQKKDVDLVIGAGARSYIRENFLNDSNELKNFYKDVRNFYKLACEYIKKKMPLESDLLKHAELVDISLRKEITFSSVDYFVQRFKKICANMNIIDNIEAQFALYQIEDFKSLDFSRMDNMWNYLLNVVDESGAKKFNCLAKLALLVLLIPHSNAYTERVFSIVRKNQTEFRPNLSTDTLSALLIEKCKSFSNEEKCFQKIFSRDQVIAAKRATTQTQTI